jgi:hypothetical protein
MAVKDVERKITKIGNSLGVTFPTEVLKRGALFYNAYRLHTPPSTVAKRG